MHISAMYVAHCVAGDDGADRDAVHRDRRGTHTAPHGALQTKEFTDQRAGAWRLAATQT